MTVHSLQKKQQSLLTSQLHTTGPRDFLRREIILTLLVKVVVILALWYVFFSEPIDDTLTDSQVSNVFFSSSLPDKAQTVKDDYNLQTPGLENASIKGEQ